MEYAVNSKEMKQFDENTMKVFQMPSCVLMERAALSVVERMKHEKCDFSHTLVVCGCGNNGGDGFAIARLLLLAGHRVTAIIVGNTAHIAEETKRQYEIYEQYCRRLENGRLLDGTVREDNTKSRSLIESRRTDFKAAYTTVVDAVFGIGLSRNIEGTYSDLLEWMNQLNGYKVAVDMPTGISADTGAVLNAAFKADLTVTFGFKKVGQILYPGKNYCGLVTVENMGIDHSSRLGQCPDVFYYDRNDLKNLPVRKSDSNKGSYGKVLCMAGTENMAGAAYFCARAAYETGAGLVRVYTHEANRQSIHTLVPEAVLNTYDDSEDRQQIEEAVKNCSVICMGPGMGTTNQAKLRLKYVLELGRVPLILDADALNLLAEDRRMETEQRQLFPEEYEQTLIFTPHLGEAARLLGVSIDEIKQDLIKAATEIAKQYVGICILKDAVTVCALPQGQIYLNTSGNNGMATGGSGDVLAGILVGLISQGMKPQEAAAMGVYLHGCAGDAAREVCGQYSMMATDILKGIRLVLKEI